MKKLIWIMGVALLVMALITAGVTIAWFTDKKETTNVFTAGDVDIKLTELDPLGDVVNVTDHAIQMDYGHVYPGLTVTKQTTVTNVGAEDAYIAMQIEITDGTQDITKALSVPGTHTGVTALDEFFFGGLWEDAFTRVDAPNSHLIVWESTRCIIQYDIGVTDGMKINIFVKDVLTSGTEMLSWGGFAFPSTWQNAQMMECLDLRISMKTYAVQASGFADCMSAVEAAFGEEFGLGNTSSTTNK